MQARAPLAALLATGLAALVPLAQGCSNDTPPEPVKPDTPATARKPVEAAGSSSAAARATSDEPRRPTRPTKKKISAKPVASVAPAEDDPLKGQWTLAEAVKDIKGTGTLLAEIELDIPSKGAGGGGGKEEKGKSDGGKLTCALFEDKTPITVANFVGLARGLRPWKAPDRKWVKKPAYDGVIFHRIIKGFMSQGGDPQGNGTSEPGYVIPDEIWEDAYHDRPGLLCMANRGPNTNGAQFFITDAAAPHLDNGYTIFGECAPVDLVHRLASVEVKGERPVSPPKIKKVTFKRGPSPVPLAPAGSASAAAPGSASTPAASASAAPAASASAAPKH